MKILTLTLVALAALTGAPSLAVAGPDAPAKAKPRPTLTVHRSAFGRVIWDGRGRALYAFTADPRGASACSGECAVAWPPLYAAGKLRAGTGIKQRLLGTVRRADGRRQVTYAGNPLYYYVGDPPGRIRCQNVDQFGGLWLVVRPNGTLVR